MVQERMIFRVLKYFIFDQLWKLAHLSDRMTFKNSLWPGTASFSIWVSPPLSLRCALAFHSVLMSTQFLTLQERTELLNLPESLPVSISSLGFWLCCPFFIIVFFLSFRLNSAFFLTNILTSPKQNCYSDSTYIVWIISCIDIFLTWARILLGGEV